MSKNKEPRLLVSQSTSKETDETRETVVYLVDDQQRPCGVVTMVTKRVFLMPHMRIENAVKSLVK